MAVTSSKTTENGAQSYAYIVGSPFMFTNQADQLTSNANLTIFTNIVNECVSDDVSTVSVPVKSVSADKFIIANNHAAIAIFLILLIVVPLVLLTAGFVIWTRRRKR